MATRNTINSNFYQIVNVDANGTPTTIKSQYVANIPAANPAGSNTQVQYNDDGSFGASGNLTFNSTTNTLTATNFSGSGTGLTNINAANITGTVPQATNSNTSNVAVTVSASYQPNITSLGVLTSVTVTGETNLGDVSNVTITGGTANYVLSTDGTGNLNWIAQSGGSGNANYANFAGTAYNVSGSNVSGEVANANYATYSGQANTSNLATYATTANSVAGANVSGVVANANYSAYANVASIANSVAVANVSGIGNIAVINLDGNASNILYGNGVFGPDVGPQDVANANYANFAGTAYNVSGANVSGEVANANYANFAGTAYSVSGSNVSGEVANSNYSTYSGTAYSVSGANVSGEVANANYATYAGTAYSVSGSNVSGEVANANYATFAGTAYSVSGANVSGEVANANYANFAGTLINGTSNITIPVANGNINFSANGVANLAVLDTTGNLTVSNTIIAQSANLAGSYNIESIGTYYPLPLVFGNYGSPNIPGYVISGDYTSGSNLITNVTLYDGFGAYTASLTDNATELTGQAIGFGSAGGVYNDTYIPLLTTIDSVDAPNNQIYMSTTATLSGTGVFSAFTGDWLSNSSTNSYWIASQAYVTNAISTDGTSNSISVTEFGLFNDGFINPGQIVQFYGTSFGNITSGTTYYVNNIDYGTSTFTISATNGGPDLALTTDTGDLTIVIELTSQNWQPLSAGYYYAGPWDNLPVLANLTQTPSGYISGGTTITTNGYFVKPVDFNYGQTPPVVYGGQYTRVDNGLVVSDGSYGTPTLTGLLNAQSPVNGVTLLHTGLDANINQSRTNYQIVDYTDNSSGNPSITNPLNPPSLSFTSYNGNVNSDPNDQYARSGRTIGRIAWYGAQQVNGVRYESPGSSPSAGIYVQALGDWNNGTNANLPMTMSFQYSPLNAATGSGTSYQRINRTFLQAANNTTTIGGATNIQFKPLARSSNGTNNRSPSALGNVSINPQTFVDISGYTQGNAVSNGAGAVLNVTTTASTWDGNVALRLSRTVGNTANMEFVLPTTTANTLVLKDNSSGNTIATFTNGVSSFTGNVDVSGNINYTRVYGQWQYDATLTPAAANTAYAVPFQGANAVTDFASVASTASTSHIIPGKAGVYKLQFSAQVENTDNGQDHQVTFWWRKNGTDVTASAGYFTVPKAGAANGALIVGWDNMIEAANNTDYWELMYAVSDTSITLPFIAASSPRPAAAAVFLTLVPAGA